MAAGILSCPNEIISQILSYLDIFDLESAARVFNKRVYHAAFRLLTPHIPWIKNARRMYALFPPSGDAPCLPAFPGRLPPMELRRNMFGRLLPGKSPYSHASLGLDPSRGDYVCTSPPPLRSFMRLDGTFGWLEPLEARLARNWVVHSGTPGERALASDEEFDSLNKRVRELGLTLPVGFETFVKSKHLHYRILSSRAWWFSLSPLAPMPSQVDRGNGGYVLKFHYDQQWCSFAYLYLEKGGGHCVLLSADDWHSYEYDYDKYHFYCLLHGLSFEEYLATVYFEQLLWYGARPFQGLKDYVKHVYRPIPADGLNFELE